eukprot:COSAG01_NODE_10501_length_2150_cov_40.916626_1_plen_412_part_00
MGTRPLTSEGCEETAATASATVTRCSAAAAGPAAAADGDDGRSRGTTACACASICFCLSACDGAAWPAGRRADAAGLCSALGGNWRAAQPPPPPAARRPRASAVAGAEPAASLCLGCGVAHSSGDGGAAAAEESIPSKSSSAPAPALRRDDGKRPSQRCLVARSNGGGAILIALTVANCVMAATVWASTMASLASDPALPSAPAAPDAPPPAVPPHGVDWPSCLPLLRLLGDICPVRRGGALRLPLRTLVALQRRRRACCRRAASICGSRHRRRRRLHSAWHGLRGRRAVPVAIASAASIVHRMFFRGRRLLSGLLGGLLLSHIIEAPWVSPSATVAGRWRARRLNSTCGSLTRSSEAGDPATSMPSGGVESPSAKSQGSACHGCERAGERAAHAPVRQPLLWLFGFSRFT